MLDGVSYVTQKRINVLCQLLRIVHCGGEWAAGVGKRPKIVFERTLEDDVNQTFCQPILFTPGTKGLGHIYDMIILCQVENHCAVDWVVSTAHGSCLLVVERSFRFGTDFRRNGCFSDNGLIGQICQTDEDCASSGCTDFWLKLLTKMISSQESTSYLRCCFHLSLTVCLRTLNLSPS